MSLSQKIAAELDAQMSQGVTAPVSVEEQGYRLTLPLIANTSIGVSMDALEFSVSGGDRSVDELRRWGDRVAARVTYLMEPLRVIEVDQEAVEAELRSQQPTARGEVRSYYEVRLFRTGTLRLERVQFRADDRKRTPAPCQFTREVLERLIDDLVDTAVPRSG